MNYHKIEKTSVANGPGVRVTLWTSGCRVGCYNCQNPQTWRFDSGELFDDIAKEELFEALDKPYIKGITFSGGHPLEPENVETIYFLIKEIKEKFSTKDIWLYTGYTLDILNFTTVRKGIAFKCEYDNCMHYNLIHEILQLCDVVVDGPFIEAEKDLTLRWCGSRNQRVIDCQETIKKGKIILYKE